MSVRSCERQVCSYCARGWDQSPYSLLKLIFQKLLMLFLSFTRAHHAVLVTHFESCVAFPLRSPASHPTTESGNFRFLSLKPCSAEDLCLPRTCSGVCFSVWILKSDIGGRKVRALPGLTWGGRIRLQTAGPAYSPFGESPDVLVPDAHNSH